MNYIKLYENFQLKKYDTFISCDIQPEYMKWINDNFHIEDYKNWLNENYKEFNTIIFLYNGHDTIGTLTEEEYIEWLYNLEFEEELLNKIIFYDKGYGFFRSCMDNLINQKVIIELVKFMWKNNIRDIQEWKFDKEKMTEEKWDNFHEIIYNIDDSLDSGEIHEYLTDTQELFYLPDLMDLLKNYNNILLTGGGLNECLKEVEICLLALDKKYELYDKWLF